MPMETWPIPEYCDTYNGKLLEAAYLRLLLHKESPKYSPVDL